MQYNRIVKEFELSGIIPLVRIDDIRDALPLAGALTSAGFKVIEIVFRSNAAKDALKLIASKCQNMLVGAGTITSVEQVDEAFEAGAQYIVTPSFNPKVVDRCMELDIPIFPGCSNATDIEQAYERKLRVVKFFPSELLGGVEMIKAFSRPYPSIRYIPTGGINSNNLNKYLSCREVLCCAGTFLVEEDLLKEGKFNEITKNVHKAINDMLDIKLDHVAINTNEQEGIKLLKTFSSLSGLNYNQGEYTVGGIEAVLENKVGELGHIAFNSPNLERCIYYLSDRGFVVDENSIKKNEKGCITKVNLKGDNAGFIIQLIKK
ncbi:MAG: bifunctional 4-hydroxy-2-oxoglutarate aldolase/2-dehydro-3-deoxy-phosphogluconate aldolase [Clostridia bacterium]